MDIRNLINRIDRIEEAKTHYIQSKLPYDLTFLQKMFLFTRSDTIYAGTNQIQRNIISERALGMPKEPRGDNKK